MTIQHKNIPDAQLHEPKGVASATAESVYHSNGLGSGSWKKVSTPSLKGLTTDGGSSDLKLVTDGAEGFTLKRNAAYGSLVINSNNNAFSAIAAADPTLASTSDYVLFTGTGAPWTSESLNGITFTTDRLTVPVTGVYKFDLWANVNQYPSTSAKLAFRYRINGSTFATRYPMTKSNAAGDSGSISASGLISLAANDYIQLYIASTVTGSVILQAVNLTLTLERQS